MLLTLTEIMTISECYPDREHFARAVIAAHEAKLREQEPVGYFCPEYMGGPVIYYQVQYSSKDDEGVVPLFEHPASIPEGWQLVPIEPTTEMIIAGNDGFHSPDMRRHTVSGCYKAMLNAAKDTK